MLSSFAFTGPPELGLPSPGAGTLEIIPRGDPLGDEDVTLTLFDGTDEVIAEHHGVLASTSIGTSGIGIRATFYACLSYTSRVPRGGGTTTCQISLQVGGSDASLALKSVLLARQFCQASRLQLRIGALETTAALSAQSTEERHFDEVAGFLDDLDALQRTIDTFFPVPATWDPAEASLLRALRIATEGGVVDDPRCSTGCTIALALPDCDEEMVATWKAYGPVAFMLEIPVRVDFESGSLTISDAIIRCADARLLSVEVTPCGQQDPL